MSLKTKTNSFIDDDIVSDRTKLEGYYRFTTDLGDNGRDLTAVNGASEVSEYTDTSNKTRYSVTLFDSSNSSYLESASPSALANAIEATDLTIGFAILTSTASGMDIINIDDNGTGSDYLRIRINSTGTLTLELYDSDTTIIEYTTTFNSFADGNWHTVSIVLGSNGNNIIIDGEYDSPSYATGSSSTTNTIPTEVSRVQLGTINDTVYIDDQLLFDFNTTVLKDSSPNNITGAVNINGVTLNTSNPFPRNSVGNFDGTQRIDIIGDSTLNSALGGLTNMTVASWVKTSSSAGQEFLDIRDTGANDYLTLFIELGKFSFVLAISGSLIINFNTNTSTYADGNWHHVAVVIGAGGNKIYVDGTQDTNLNYFNGNSSTATILSTVTQVVVSADIAKMVGQLDDVLISSHLYTATEISKLYNYLPPQPLNGYLDVVSFVSENLSLPERNFTVQGDGLQIERCVVKNLQVERILIKQRTYAPSIIRRHTTSTQNVGTSYEPLETNETVFTSGDITESSNVYTLPSEGFYQFFAQCAFGSNSSGLRALCFRDNDTPARCFGTLLLNNLGTTGVRLAASAVIYYDGITPSTYTITPEVTTTINAVSLTTSGGIEPVIVSIVKIM